jgi:hypothetical protein
VPRAAEQRRQLGAARPAVKDRRRQRGGPQQLEQHRVGAQTVQQQRQPGAPRQREVGRSTATWRARGAPASTVRARSRGRTHRSPPSRPAPRAPASLELLAVVGVAVGSDFWQDLGVNSKGCVETHGWRVFAQPGSGYQQPVPARRLDPGMTTATMPAACARAAAARRSASSPKRGRSRWAWVSIQFIGPGCDKVP